MRCCTPQIASSNRGYIVSQSSDVERSDVRNVGRAETAPSPANNPAGAVAS